MHIGIEIKKDIAHLAFVTGAKNDLSVIKEFKVDIGGESVQYFVDFRDSLSMLFKEEAIAKVSMVEGGNDSSKMRTILEYLVKEICFVNNITINTYSSPHLNELKKKYLKTTGSDTKNFLLIKGFHAYSENAFAVAWRFA